MKKYVLALALAVVSVSVVGDLAFGSAHAPQVALLTGAPPGLDAPFGPSHPPLIDPSADPAGWGRSVLDAFVAGRYALAVVLLLWGIDLGLVWASQRWPRGFGWAGGKTKPWLVGGASALAALAATLSASADVEWRAVLGAVALAVSLYLAPGKERS